MAQSEGVLLIRVIKESRDSSRKKGGQDRLRMSAGRRSHNAHFPFV